MAGDAGAAQVGFGAMAEQTAQVNGVEIVHETIGDPSDPALLLVMGLGMQLIHWDRELCERSPSAGST